MLVLLLSLGILAAQILLMVKAYNSGYELPTIGPMARAYSRLQLDGQWMRVRRHPRSLATQP
jgi:uncharacterized membrane protein